MNFVIKILVFVLFINSSTALEDEDLIIEDEQTVRSLQEDAEWDLLSEVKKANPVYESTIGETPVDKKIRALHQNAEFKKADKSADSKIQFLSQIPRNGNVLVLNESNFDLAVSATPDMIVKFYSPKCEHCKKFAPEFSKAARELSKNNSFLWAKLDISAYAILGRRYGVSKLPTIKYLSGGSFASDYDGPFTKQGLVNWINNLGAPLRMLETPEDFVKFDQKRDVRITGFYPSKNDSEFRIVARTLVEAKFALVGPNFLRDFTVKSQDMIVLFRPGDRSQEKFTGDGLYNRSQITDFIREKSVANFTEITGANVKLIFKSNFKNFFLISGAPEDPLYAELKQSTQLLLPSYSGKLKFIFNENADNKVYANIADRLGIQKKKEEPAARIFGIGPTPSDEWISYKLDLQLETVSTDMQKFIDNYFEGKLPVFRKIQRTPENWSKGAVKILTAENFDSVVMDETKDVLVEFYAPWCKHCQAFDPIYNYLAQTLQKNKSTIVAKIDVTKNDLETVKIRGFPTIRLYRSDNKEGLNFAGMNTFKHLSQFVTSRGGDFAENVVVRHTQPKKNELWSW